MGKNLKKRQAKARVSRKIAYNRPKSSPYELPFVTLVIGEKRYVLPGHFLHRYPMLDQRVNGSLEIDLSSVHEDVGHTVVHFLYSGSYETINSPLDEGASDMTREYKRSILAYHASRSYGLSGLEVISKQKIEQLGEDLPVSEILRATRDVLSSLPVDETWLPLYIERNLQRLVQPGRTDLEDLFDALGQDHRFDNTVMRITVDILCSRLMSLEGTPKEDGPRNEGKDGAVEATPEEPALEQRTTTESILKELNPEQPALEEPIPKSSVSQESVPEAFPAEASPAKEPLEDLGVRRNHRVTDDSSNAPHSFVEAAHTEELPSVETPPAESPAEPAEPPAEPAARPADSQSDHNQKERVPLGDLALYDNR